MPFKDIALTGIVFFAVIQAVLGAAGVRLTQETPCLTGRPCVLKCSVVSGQNQGGLEFSSLVGQVVSCKGRDDCISKIPAWYNFTQVDSTTSFLHISGFSAARDEGVWTCRENTLNSTNSTIHLRENVSPSGLTYGITCVSGRATSPALLKCSLNSPGVPPATVSLMDSSNQSMNSSHTGSVTGTVTRGGHASCSVRWSTFPSYSLNISPVLCDVQFFPSVSAPGVVNLVAREDQRVTLSCDAKGYPRPRITWSHHGSIENVDVDGTGIQESLTLTPNRSDGVRQTVTCTASNPAGSAVVSFFLLVQYPPPGPPVISGFSPDDSVLKGDDVTLNCNVTGGNPPVSSVTLTCPRHNSTSQGQATTLAFAAGRGDQGSCVCSAFHVLGYTQTADVSITVHSDSCSHAAPVAITFFVTLFISVITTLLAVWCWRRIPGKCFPEPNISGTSQHPGTSSLPDTPAS